jgi:hypothetical protein
MAEAGGDGRVNVSFARIVCSGNAVADDFLFDGDGSLPVGGARPTRRATVAEEPGPSVGRPVAAGPRLRASGLLQLLHEPHTFWRPGRPCPGGSPRRPFRAGAPAIHGRR